MNTRPSRFLIALVSLLVFLMSGQAGVQGYVWCLGDDGHAALEYAPGAGCETDPPRQGGDPGPARFSPEEENCGPCLDLPAFVDVAARRLETAESTLSPAAVPVLQTLLRPLFVPSPATDFSSQPPPRISQTLLAHRTVVLLN